MSRSGIGPAEVFVAVENLFDTSYGVGKGPATSIVSIRAPLPFHDGLRCRF
jgi:hypothetical protein